MNLVLDKQLLRAGLLGLTTWIAAAASAHAGVLHGPVINPANGHSYYLLTQNDWTNSELEAQALGGHLATIRNAAENQWLFDTFSTFGGVSRALWIGINDVASEGTYVWASGETPGFTLWAPNQPDNFVNLEHFGHLFPPTWASESYWNDFQDQTIFGAFPVNGVVEIVPPCGSSFASYCTAGRSASDCQAQLSAAGAASASAPSGFDVVASGVEGSMSGMFFYGANGRQARTWGNGTSFMCVIPPVNRGGLLVGSGTTGQCDGAFSQDLNARFQAKRSQNPGAGAVCQAQLWYLDPLNTSNRGSSLSNAIEFCVAP